MFTYYITEYHWLETPVRENMNRDEFNIHLYILVLYTFSPPYFVIFSHMDAEDIYVIDTVRVFLPKCPLTTVRSCFSADKLQDVRGEAEDTFVVRPH